MRTKCSIATLAVVALVFGLSLIHISEANYSGALTVQEMDQTFGACYNCDTTGEDPDQCKRDGCPGCVAGSSCPLLVQVGTNNTQNYCYTETEADGICRKVGDIECYSTYYCLGDGATQSPRECDDNCIGGEGSCRECVQHSKYAGPYDVPTYQCIKC